MNHILKINYEFAQLHFLGLKDWEIRKNDKDFKVGDTIQFQIIELENSKSWVSEDMKSYKRIVTNVFSDPEQKFGLQPDHVILSIAKTTQKHGCKEV